MASKIIDDLMALGYSVSLEGENIKLRYLGIGNQPVGAQPLITELKTRKCEAITYLREAQPKPHFDLACDLVIPFSSDPRYHWWNGGQSANKTEMEAKTWLTLTERLCAAY